MAHSTDITMQDLREIGPLDDAASWVDSEVMEARIRAVVADPGLRRVLDELQPDTIADL